MSEETEARDTGAGAAAGDIGCVDPVALALALDGASRDDAGAFLKKQGALVDEQRGLVGDQRYHLHVQLKQIYLGLWE